MDKVAIWMFTNFFTWTAIAGLIHGYFKKDPCYNLSANMLRFVFLWYVCIAFTISGVMHLFFGDFTADKIGWANSPFQFEIGLANLSFAVLGAFSFAKKDKTLWLAVILALVIQTTGAGFGHVYQMIANNNTAVSNSGLIMYTDILAPIVMYLLWFQSDLQKKISSN